MSEVNPTYLYVLSEDDNDDLFYEMCASRIASKSYYLVDRRIRKNGGISAVRKAIRPFLNDLKSAAELDAYFIIALDNDRAPDHNNGHRRLDGLSKSDASKGCRVCEIERIIKSQWGQNPANWPVKGAVGVPVEMFESWLLTGLAPGCAATLPAFSAKSKQSAVTFYGGSPPDQLKDLFNNRLTDSAESNKSDFILKIASELDLDAVADASPSFHHFRQQVLNW